ncbi:putative SP-containing protein [Vairimorpha necatrix]|uniref:SP-containing protein n=1 Tax=Vairimorpha necatrix TaxID=6039 RepID=A0AAX4J8K0_9MICR
MLSGNKTIYTLFHILSSIFSSINNENFDKNKAHKIQMYDLRFKRTAKDIVECEYLERNLNKLKPKELDVLYNVIDNQLIKNRDDHYLLLVELGRSIDIFNDLNLIKNNLNNVPTDCDKDFHINDEHLRQIRVKNKKFYDMGLRLRCNTAIHIKTLKTLFTNADLNPNKIDFYMYVIDFVEKFINFPSNTTHNYYIENNYQTFLNHYQTLEYCMHNLFNNIPLSKILCHTEGCILQEITINTHDLHSIKKHMKQLVKFIEKSYKNIDKYVSPIKDICDLIEMENVKN